MKEEKELIPVTDPSQVPDGMTEEEARDFWDTHSLTEEYFERTEPIPEDELPPTMSREELLKRRERWKR